MRGRKRQRKPGTERKRGGGGEREREFERGREKWQQKLKLWEKGNDSVWTREREKERQG